MPLLLLLVLYADGLVAHEKSCFGYVSAIRNIRSVIAVPVVQVCGPPRRGFGLAAVELESPMGFLNCWCGGEGPG